MKPLRADFNPSASPPSGLIATVSEPRIHPTWLEVLGDELEAPHMQELRAFLRAEKDAGRSFYPPSSLVFNALWTTPFDEVRAVVLGQDPYHGAGQAMGLCFSVPAGLPLPPSLRNIYDELVRDLGIERPTTGDLTPWAERGVLLLNAVLTVAPAKPASHAGKGWELFTTRAIRELSDRRSGIVFLLWGRYAQQKGEVVDGARHHVLTAAHPSPFSVDRFRGCGHFSRANALLEEGGLQPVDWSLP